MTIIQVKKSSTVTTGIPAKPASLLFGELAINYATGYESIFLKSATGAIITINDWGHILGKPTSLSGYGVSATDVTSQAMTGFSVGTNSTILATDTIISALGKVQGQINGHTHSIFKGLQIASSDGTKTVSISVDSNGFLHFDKTIYSDGGVSALGAGSGGGSGSGLVSTVYSWSNLSYSNAAFNESTLTDTFNAFTINRINNRFFSYYTQLESDDRYVSKTGLTTGWFAVMNFRTYALYLCDGGLDASGYSYFRNGLGITGNATVSGTLTVGGVAITPTSFAALNGSLLQNFSVNNINVAIGVNLPGAYTCLDFDGVKLDYWFALKAGLATQSFSALNLTAAGTISVTGTATITGEAILNGGISIRQSTGDGLGIALYNAFALNPTYGIMFAKTVNKGTYGSVNADWATYFTMSNTAGRGWIWTYDAVTTAGNVAALDTSGTLTLAGGVNSAGVVKAVSFKVSALNTAPAQGAAGTPGDIRFATDGYLYLCVATNTWKRSLLSTY